jgi:hypothetical protein
MITATRTLRCCNLRPSTKVKVPPALNANAENNHFLILQISAIDSKGKRVKRVQKVHRETQFAVQQVKYFLAWPIDRFEKRLISAF